MTDYQFILGNATAIPLADKSVDLVFGSPPYESQRTYSIGFNLKGQEWVDFMVKVFVEGLRVSRGLVAFVLEGYSKDFQWSATPAMLMADLHRKGIVLRKPQIFHRVGIPGSGGPDWLRNDYEFIVCATNGGKLPWSQNTAMGHKPKWGPGGEMSNRLSNGCRVNQWGKVGSLNGAGNKDADGKIVSHMRPSHKFMTMTSRGKNGERKLFGGRKNLDGIRGEKIGTAPRYNGDILANPGNVIEEKYTAEQVATILEESSEIAKCTVGGGAMGSKHAHDNEAPFPETLVEFFVRSFCPPDGLVCDPFSGSGTTVAAAVKAGRRGIGIDIRQSQIDLGEKRLAEICPLFTTGAA